MFTFMLEIKLKIMFRKIASLFTVAVLFFLLNSCNNSQKKIENESTEAPKSMVTEEPKDDGQGVGKFKNISLAAIDEKLAEQGKVIFDAKCAVCHILTDQKLIGPGLKGVTERRQAAWILNMMTNPVEMTHKDLTAKALLAEHHTQMTFQDVEDDQAKLILEFLRANDEPAKEEVKK